MNTNFDERNLNFDELLQELEQKPQQPQAEPAATLDPFDKEAYRERKQAERAEAFRLADITAEKAAASGEVYADYLNVQARYNRYSVNNALLIVAQMPTATKLATFDEWRQNNVQIRGGAKAITLLEPGREFQREDGSIGASFNVKKVFDISQTHALQQPQAEVHRDQRLMMKALISNPPCKLEVSDDQVPANSAAVYKPEAKTIYVRHGLNFDDMFRALARELAFAHMDKGGSFSRAACEFQARSVAYLVCARNHIAPEQVTFPSSYSNLEAKDIKQVLGEIREVANIMHGSMSKVLDRQTQEARTQNPRDRDAR